MWAKQPPQVFVATPITPQGFCTDINGTYDPEGSTCTIETRSDGVQPSCFRAMATHVMADDHGPCYNFMRLPNGRYRQQYRLNETCFAQLPQFQRMATNPQNGVCANTETWPNNPGSFVEQKQGVVTPEPPTDPRSCRIHRTESRCESDPSCNWAVSSSFVQCAPGQDCTNACYAMGGDLKDGECVVPQCRPKVASEMPCNT